MKNKLINSLINSLMKVVMISGMVVMFNIVNVVPSFASEVDNSITTISDFCNKYKIIYNGKVDDTPVFYYKNFKSNSYNDLVDNYSNKSWSICNSNTNKYIFKPIESDKEIIFDNSKELKDSLKTYQKIKETNESQILRKACLNIGNNVTAYSDKKYVNDLKTNSDLQEYAKQWLKDNYNLTLDISIYYSDLNKGYNDITKDSINGRFNYNKDTNLPISIEIEKEYSKVSIFSERTLIHELTHYALNKLGKSHNDDDEVFNSELLKHGGLNNNGIRGSNFYSHLNKTV